MWHTITPALCSGHTDQPPCRRGPHKCLDARMQGSWWVHLEAEYHTRHLATFKDLAFAYFSCFFSYYILSISLITMNYFLILWPLASNALCLSKLLAITCCSLCLKNPFNPLYFAWIIVLPFMTPYCQKPPWHLFPPTLGLSLYFHSSPHLPLSCFFKFSSNY